MHPSTPAEVFASLLSQCDLPAEALDPSSAWRLFSAFIRHPLNDPRVRDEEANFQTGQRDWGDGHVGPCASFLRSWTLWDDELQEYIEHPAQDDGTWGVTFGFRLPRHALLPPREVLIELSDFASVDEFLASVEADAGFTAFLTMVPLASSCDVAL